MCFKIEFTWFDSFIWLLSKSSLIEALTGSLSPLFSFGVSFLITGLAVDPN